MNNKQVILYNKAKQATLEYNQETPDGLIHSSQLNTRQDKIQTGQLNNLIALSTIGFSELDDQIQILSHTIKEIHLEAKSEKQEIIRALETINKKIDRTIHNQEIQPNTSLLLVELNKKVDEVQKLTISTNNFFRENLIKLEEINTKLELIPRDTQITDNLEPQIKTLENSLESIYNNTKNEELNNLINIILNNQNNIIKVLSEQGQVRINPIITDAFITYNPPNNE